MASNGTYRTNTNGGGAPTTSPFLKKVSTDAGVRGDF
jgi:hypothetical protein